MKFLNFDFSVENGRDIYNNFAIFVFHQNTWNQIQ